MLCFHAEKYVTSTIMLKFLLTHGAVVEDINWAVAYVEGRPLTDFIGLQTIKRIEADQENQPHKSKLRKLVVNSCYGRASVSLCKFKKLRNHLINLDESFKTSESEIWKWCQRFGNSLV